MRGQAGCRRDAAPIGRIGRLCGGGNRKLLFDAALDGNGPKLAISRGCPGARRDEEHAFAIRRESLRDIRRGMIGQPARRAARGGNHVHVCIAVVVAAERDQRSIGRERGRALVSIGGGEAANVRAVEAGGPEVARIYESDSRGADRRLREEPRVRCTLRICSARHAEQREGSQY